MVVSSTPVIMPDPKMKRMTLFRWGAFKVRKGGLHLCGFIPIDGARVSSPIVQFDVISRSGITVHGQLYRFVGVPGLAVDKKGSSKKWMNHNGISMEEITFIDMIDIPFVVNLTRPDV